jgi:hypothetical protein
LPRFIENRHEIDEKVVESSQIGDACRLKHYRWVNKYAMSRQRQLMHTPWHRQSSFNNCLHVRRTSSFMISFFWIEKNKNENCLIQFINSAVKIKLIWSNILYQDLETSSDCRWPTVTWSSSFSLSFHSLRDTTAMESVS